MGLRAHLAPLHIVLVEETIRLLGLTCILFRSKSITIVSRRIISPLLNFQFFNKSHQA